MSDNDFLPYCGGMKDKSIEFVTEVTGEKANQLGGSGFVDAINLSNLIMEHLNSPILLGSKQMGV